MKSVFPNLVEFAYILKPHGFDGQLKLKTDSPLLNANSFPTFIWIYRYGKPVPFKVFKFQKVDAEHVVVQLEDLHCDQDAIRLKNELCYCEESEFDYFFELEESYEYLIGLRVQDNKYGEIGEVTDILENEKSHSTLVVIKDNLEIMIPFVNEIILEINEEEGHISTQIPDGLLDLYC